MSVTIKFHEYTYQEGKPEVLQYWCKISNFQRYENWKFVHWLCHTAVPWWEEDIKLLLLNWKYSGLAEHSLFWPLSNSKQWESFGRNVVTLNLLLLCQRIS